MKDERDDEEERKKRKKNRDGVGRKRKGRRMTGVEWRKVRKKVRKVEIEGRGGNR